MDKLWPDDEYNSYLFGDLEDREALPTENKEDASEHPPIASNLDDENPHRSRDDKSTVPEDATEKGEMAQNPDEATKEAFSNPPIAGTVADEASVQNETIQLTETILDPSAKETQVADFSCTECDEVCSHAGALERHVQEIHRKNKFFECPECKDSFSRKYRVKEHYEAVHGKKYEKSVAHPSATGSIPQASISKPPRIPQSMQDKVLMMDQLKRTCPECGVHFSSHATKDAHFAKKHKKENMLRCAKCPMKFANRQDFDEHVHSEHRFPAGSAGAGPSSMPLNAGSSSTISVATGSEFQEEEPAMSTGGSHAPRNEMPFAPLEMTPMQSAETVKKSDGSADPIVPSHSSAAGAGTVQKRFSSAVEKADSQGPRTETGGIADNTSNTAGGSSERNAKRQKVSDFNCTKCGKVFSYAAARDRHIQEIHEKEKSFKCPECQRAFSRKYRVKEHYEAVHGKKYEAPVEDLPNTLFCEMCAVKFSTKRELEKHVRLSHGSSSSCASAASVGAGIIGATSAGVESAGTKSISNPEPSPSQNAAQTEEGLQNKLKDAQLARRTCPECGLVLVSIYARDRHRDAVHKNEKPFECDVCKSKFSRKHRLQEHIKAVHERPASFKCPACPKEYAHKKNLDKHMEKEGHSAAS